MTPTQLAPAGKFLRLIGGVAVGVAVYLGAADVTPGSPRWGVLLAVVGVTFAVGGSFFREPAPVAEVAAVPPWLWPLVVGSLAFAAVVAGVVLPLVADRS